MIPYKKRGTVCIYLHPHLLPLVEWSKHLKSIFTLLAMIIRSQGTANGTCVRHGIGSLEFKRTLTL